MQFVNDPAKCKKVFILMLVLAIVFFLAAGTLGYLYYAKHNDYKSLQTEKEAEKEALEQQLETAAEDLQKEVEKLEKQKTDLENEKKSLEDQVTASSAKLKTVKAYMDSLSYLIGLIETHNGMDNWTEAEFQQGRQLVQTTGDQNFLNVVDAAWADTGGDQTIRLLNVLKALASGVNSNL